MRRTRNQGNNFPAYSFTSRAITSRDTDSRKMSDKTKSSEGAVTLKDLQDKIAKDADFAVRVEMPKRILMLHKLIQDNEELRRIVPLKVTTFEPTIVSENGEQSDVKKRKIGDVESTGLGDAVPVEERATVPCNERVIEMMNLLKSEVLESIRILGTVKTWIQLSIPKIEDGNNFGVGVQEECAAELGRVEESGFTILDSMTKYFQNRARLVHKMAKHPKVMDYRQAVIECDEGQFSNLRLCLVDIRDNLAMMHDLLTKNLDRIRKPRPEHNMLY